MTGKLLETGVIYPHEPQGRYDQSLEKVAELCKKHQVKLIAIGNGTASRESDRFVGDLLARMPALGALKVIVSEAGASVYSASAFASQEFPSVDVSLRGAISIGRRLQDPLAELVKIDPKSIGVGQYQHDVSENKLSRALDAVVEDCVNGVGVDLNTASVPLLARVSGLNETLARNIVLWRDAHGAFRNRNQLKEIARLCLLYTSLMAQQNGTRHQTAFTVSIEAREGVSTGISAADRARTVAVAIDPAKGRGDIVTPGHVFPLVAREGGVLVRVGHTEAAVDIARLAGRAPAGVICEIMNDDGTMARLPDLVKFAQTHNLKIATIADLIEWRRRREKLVQVVTETTFDSRYGGQFRLIVYRNTVAYAEHVALVKGDITQGGPVAVRMHALSILEDVLGNGQSTHSGDLQAAMQAIGAIGRGVLVLIREPSPTSLSDRLRAGHSEPGFLRDYGVGAQILLDLGVREMELLTNAPKTIVGLDGYGLTIVGHRPLPSV